MQCEKRWQIYMKEGTKQHWAHPVEKLRLFEKVALEEAFDAISDGTNISKSKPDPEVFLKAAEYLDLQPEECIVVEDAYAGIDAAKAGNMQAVGTGEAYSYAKADYHIKKLKSC